MIKFKYFILLSLSLILILLWFFSPLRFSGLYDYYDLKLDRNNNLLSLFIGNPIINEQIKQKKSIRIKWTDYEQIKMENFHYQGTRPQINALRLDLNVYHQKWKKILAVRTRLYKRETHVDGHLYLSVKDRQFHSKYVVLKTSSSWVSGVFGLMINPLDAMGQMIGIMTNDKVIKTTDIFLSVGGNIGSRLKKSGAVSIGRCIDQFAGAGILVPDQINVVKKGVWLVFKYRVDNTRRILHLVRSKSCR